MKYKEHSETWRKNGLADLKYKVLNRVPLAKGTEKVRCSSRQTNVAHYYCLSCRSTTTAVSLPYSRNLSGLSVVRFVHWTNS